MGRTVLMIKDKSWLISAWNANVSTLQTAMVSAVLFSGCKRLLLQQNC